MFFSYNFSYPNFEFRWVQTTNSNFCGFQIAAAVLNGVLKRGEREAAAKRLAEIEDKKFQTIFGLLYKVNEKIDLFSKYNVDELFECRILSVDEKYRGRGLANLLMANTVDIAKKNGFKVPLELRLSYATKTPLLTHNHRYHFSCFSSLYFHYHFFFIASQCW